MNNPFFSTFDLETTSRDTQTAKICEICITKIDKETKKIVDKFHKYVNPMIEIDPDAVKVHGLTNDFLSNHLPFKDLAQLVANFLEGSDINGYNIVKFDIPILQRELDEANVDFVISQKCKILDSYIVFERDTPRNLAAALLYYTGEEIKDAHKANGDVDTTIAIVLKQLEEHPEMSFDDMCKYSLYDKEIFDINGKFYKDKNGDVCLTFGKYKDVKISHILKVDKGYINWILSLQDFPISSKNILEKIIR